MKIFDNGDKGFFVKCDSDEKAAMIKDIEERNTFKKPLIDDDDKVFLSEIVAEKLKNSLASEIELPGVIKLREISYESGIDTNTLETVLKAIQSFIPGMFNLSWDNIEQAVTEGYEDFTEAQRQERLKATAK